MLGFFRRFQKFFFAIVTAVVVASFLFFGTTGSLFHREEVVDRQVGELVDGSPLMERSLYGLIRILEHGIKEGTRSPNLLSDSFIHREFILSGLGKTLAESAFVELRGELEQRWERAQNSVSYQHPFVPHINAKYIWTQFSPGIVDAIEKVKAHQGNFSKEQLSLLFDCYVAQAAFPPPLLHQMLWYCQQQSKDLPPDPGLHGANVSVFGFQTVEDWFGSKFVEKMATFIFNAASIAKAEGYRVSADEVRRSLFANVANGIKLLNEGKDPQLEEVKQVYAMQIRRVGLSEQEVVSLWGDVLAVERMFQEVGQGVFFDSMALDQFKSFAKKGVTVIEYRLPQVLHFTTLRDMLKFQRYKEIVSKDELLGLPEDLRDAQEVMDLHPELVCKQFDVEIATISKEEVASHISLKQTWEWEADPVNFAHLQQEYPQLVGKPSATCEERMETLDTLDDQTRFRLDHEARLALIDAHPQWVEEEVQRCEVERLTLEVRLEDRGNPLSGSHFLALLESDSPELSCYTTDGNLFYRIVTLNKEVGWSLVSFEEASDVLDEKLDQTLHLAYEAEEREGSFEEMKNQIGAELYVDLIRAIDPEATDLDTLAPHRFDRYLNQLRHLAISDPDQFAIALEKPYAPHSSTKTLSIEVGEMEEGEFAPIADRGFYQLIEKVEQLATEEEVARAKGHLMDEAKYTLMCNLIEQF